MFGKMTIGKALAAVCGAALLFLLGQSLANGIYFSPAPRSNDFAYLADVVAQPTEDANAAPAPAAPETFDAAFAQADVSKGERLFNKCRACHRLEKGVNATGPSLYGVVGRDIASIPDFNYSAGWAAHKGEVWTPEKLSTYLTEPNAFTPGNAMGNAQAVRNLQDRADLIAYLQQAGG